MKGSIATHVLYVPPFPIPVTAALAAIGPPPPSLPPARRGYAAVAVADSTFVRRRRRRQHRSLRSGVAILVGPRRGRGRGRSLEMLPVARCAALPLSLPPHDPSFLPSFLPSFRRRRASAVGPRPSVVRRAAPLCGILPG